MFNKEKRQEKRARKEAVKATLEEQIKPRATFAQRQQKTELAEKRQAERAAREGKVAEHLKAVLTGNGAGEIVQFGSELLYTQGLSNLHLQVQDQLSGPDKCCTRWQLYGKHDSEFLGMAPTNRDVQFSGVSITSMAEDKITQDFHYWDMVALLQQIQAP